MNYANFASYVRKLTKSDSVSFSDNDLTLFSNIAKDDIAEEIVQLDEDYFLLGLDTDLVAGQREYSFPLDMLKNMKMAEINLKGDGVWRRLHEFDLNSYRQEQSHVLKKFTNLNVEGSFSNATTDEETIQKTFTDENPIFDIDGESMFIYTKTLPIAVTDGLKLKATIYPTNYTNASWVDTDDMSIRENSTSTALPRASHELLARRTAIIFKESNQIPLNEFDLSYEKELQDVRNKLNDQNMDRTTVASVPRDTGFNY